MDSKRLCVSPGMHQDQSSDRWAYGPSRCNQARDDCVSNYKGFVFLFRGRQPLLRGCKLRCSLVVLPCGLFWFELPNFTFQAQGNDLFFILKCPKDNEGSFYKKGGKFFKDYNILIY